MAIPVLLLLYVISIIDSKGPVPTTLMVTRIGPCYPANYEPLRFSEMVISCNNVYETSVSGRFTISEDIDNGWTVIATIQKCQDIRNLATCNLYQSFPLVNDSCTANVLATKILSRFKKILEHTTPKLSCPIKAGSYKITAYTFSPQDLFVSVSEAKTSTSIFGYTYKIEGFLTKQKLFCVEAHLQLLYIREMNHPNGTT